MCGLLCQIIGPSVANKASEILGQHSAYVFVCVVQSPVLGRYLKTLAENHVYLAQNGLEPGGFRPSHPPGCAGRVCKFGLRYLRGNPLYSGAKLRVKLDTSTGADGTCKAASTLRA